jgi:hypothetical protein
VPRGRVGEGGQRSLSCLMVPAELVVATFVGFAGFPLVSSHDLTLLSGPRYDVLSVSTSKSS